MTWLSEFSRYLSSNDIHKKEGCKAEVRLQAGKAALDFIIIRACVRMESIMSSFNVFRKQS